MEGQRKRLGELNTDELLNKLLSQSNLVAKGAKVLHENDIDGAVFEDMVDEEFNEISGLSFGVKKSLIKYRKKLLEEEKEFVQKCQRPVLEIARGSASAADKNRIPVSDIIIAKPDDNNSQYLQNKVDIEQTFGQEDSEGKQDFNVDSSDFFKQSFEISAEGVPENTTSSIFRQSKETASQNEDSDCISCMPKAAENLIRAGPPRVEYKKETGPSKKSLILSQKSLIKQKQLKNFIFNDEVKWKEQGKERSTKDFMKLRSAEIVLEGYLQKLAGSNSRFKLSHWANRYAILLKSGVLLNFDCRNKKLYYKGFADLTKMERFEIPQNTSGANALRLEIHTTTKRVVLGFSSEAEMLIWRNEIFAIIRKDEDDGKGEDEKDN